MHRHDRVESPLALRDLVGRRVGVTAQLGGRRVEEIAAGHLGPGQRFVEHASELPASAAEIEQGCAGIAKLAGQLACLVAEGKFLDRAAQRILRVRLVVLAFALAIEKADVRDRRKSNAVATVRSLADLDIAHLAALVMESAERNEFAVLPLADRAIHRSVPCLAVR